MADSRPTPAPGPETPATGPSESALASVAHLLAEQWQDWERGQRVPVEAYLARHPGVQADPEALLDLIANEVRLREQAGERPQVEEYLARFPECGSLLRVLFFLDRALQPNSGAPTLPPAAPGAAAPAPAPPVSVAALVEDLRAGELLTPAQLHEVLADLHHRFPLARSLAGELIRRAWLTPYQVNQLLQGRGRQLLLGPYVLLERLGEGGMGQVLKARHRKLGRVVAVKLIRREFLVGADTVHRFRREIRAAAQLDHPNIVHAYDADEVGGTHFFAMEYVEGPDLARLVKQRGPLPVAEACDYARQAALGLQHAHERGLVHRDVKPSNLLLTRQGLVKLLDLGLARLTGAAEESAAGSFATREGAVMGSPDFLAPEQAEDPRRVDIRADLYALGCTLYFLLTGRVPFPGGTLAEKVVRHLAAEPEPVECLRPDVPAGVAAVVRRLMAKRPGDRYQTPADVAAALAAAVTDRREPAAVAADETHRDTMPGGTPTAPPAERGFSVLTDPVPAAPTASSYARRRTVGRRRRLGLAAAGALALCAPLAGLFLLAWHLASRDLGPPAAGPGSGVDRPAEAPSFDEWRQAVARLAPASQAKTVALKLQELNPGFDGKFQCRVEDNRVVELAFAADRVTDLTPVRALPSLRRLDCAGSGTGRGKLQDLGPLHGTDLHELHCPFTEVSDLSPLQGLPLGVLDCTGTKVQDLKPLEQVPLTTLLCDDTPVASLAPLHGLRLTRLQCGSTRVKDLLPLQGMPLESLVASESEVTDLTPLRDMPLATLSVGHTPVKDLAPLKGLPLGALYCPFTGVADLSPLQGMPLQNLNCAVTPLKNLCPLQGMRSLRELNVGISEVDELTPLRGLSLVVLDVSRTRIRDLSPLQGMTSLKSLSCQGTHVASLAPLRGLSLTILRCSGTRVIDLSPVADQGLEELDFRDVFDPRRDAAVLRLMDTLKTINGKPAAAFWREVDSSLPGQP